MKTKPKKTVVICSSAAFYKQVMETKRDLEKLGFRVAVPLTAAKMYKARDFNVGKVKTWLKNRAHYGRKTFLTKNHFNKVAKGDIVLVLNYEKRGIAGYIGGAVLMEMGLACYLGKPIYILNPIQKGISIEEEVYGVLPTFLNGNLSLIS